MPDQAPRVLHLVWNLIRGGTEGQCARVAMELAKRRYPQRVWVFRREGFFLNAVEQLCGPVEEVGISGLFSSRLFKEMKNLAHRMVSGGFDIVHAWDADAAIFGQFAAERARIPFITSRRDLGEIYPWYKQILLRRADRCARVIVANTQAIVDRFAREDAPREKFRLVPNLLDLDEFDREAAKPIALPFDWDPSQTVVMVARLDPEKDHATFLRAAARVVRQRPSTAFLIAGEGRERPRLDKMIHRLGLQKNVLMLGEVHDVPALLRKAAIGVLTPVRNEGLSNTILEYMAAGLPVVATDCGGNRELVDPPRGGFIVHPSDDQGIANALIRLLENPALRAEMGAHNRARVERDHQPSAIADRFASLYDDALAIR